MALFFVRNAKAYRFSFLRQPRPQDQPEIYACSAERAQSESEIHPKQNTLNPSAKSSAPSITESAEYKTDSIRISRCSLPFSFGIKDKTNGHHGHYE